MDHDRVYEDARHIAPAECVQLVWTQMESHLDTVFNEKKAPEIYEINYTEVIELETHTMYEGLSVA
jgi:hypothetical protein